LFIIFSIFNKYFVSKIYNTNWKYVKSIYHLRRRVTEFHIGWLLRRMLRKLLLFYMYIHLLRTFYLCLTVNPFILQEISSIQQRSLSPVVEFREIMRKSRDSINHRVPEVRSVSLSLSWSNSNTFTSRRYQFVGDIKKDSITIQSKQISEHDVRSGFYKNNKDSFIIKIIS